MTMRVRILYSIRSNLLLNPTTVSVAVLRMGYAEVVFI